MAINTPTGWDDKLNSIMEEWKTLSDKEKEDLLKMFQEDKMEGEKNSEIPQELRAYREAWKESIIRFYGTEARNRIINAAKEISVKMETDSDGSKLVEFKLWSKTYKILNPKLKTHSDDEYKYKYNIDDDYTEVILWWMELDNVDEWKNKKLKEYVKQKQAQWLHIPKVEEINLLLNELGQIAWLRSKGDKIAMLMYLVGMHWSYWLSMWDHENSGSSHSRSLLRCLDDNRRLDYAHSARTDSNASLCMISCE